MTPGEPALNGPRITRVERNGAGQLVVFVEGRSEPYVDARVARCFPWSVPDTYVSVRNKDGKEIALLRGLDGLEDQARKLIEEELRDKVFNPRILRILDFKSEFGVTSITAQTDRGKVTFQVRTRDDVRVLSPTRALFRDADGNTYELADLTALEDRFQKQLSHFF